MPSRICSLLPSATEIIADLGLVDSLVGVSEECRWPPEVVGKPIVTAPKRSMAELSNAEIDETVRASLGESGSLYAIDVELIESLEPDVIVTQDLCPVCAVSSGDLATACAVPAEIVSLDPMTLEGVARSIEVLAARLDVADRGVELAERMRQSLAETGAATAAASRRRVFVAEWVEPPFSAGHWVPEMVALAGGEDVLGRPGERSQRTTWEAVLAREPELVVVAACGFDADEALRRTEGLELPVPIVVVNGDRYFSRPGPRLADGTRQLAHVFHPERVADPGLPLHRVPAVIASP
jgi:iron complex transport system substrate-binding protein